MENEFGYKESVAFLDQRIAQVDNTTQKEKVLNLQRAYRLFFEGRSLSNSIDSLKNQEIDLFLNSFKIASYFLTDSCYTLKLGRWKGFQEFQREILKKYTSYQKYLEQRLFEIQDNQLINKAIVDSSGYSSKQEIYNKWINITRFLEELAEPQSASTTSPNLKRGIWDYVNAFQEMLDRIFEEDFSSSGFFVNECSDLDNFDPSSLGIALFYHRLLQQDPETGRFYYNVLSLPRIVYISVRKGWDGLTEDAMNWSVHQEISSCASILMIIIHTGVSGKQQQENYPSMNSSDLSIPYQRSDKRLNTYHIDVNENANAQEIVRIFEKIVDPMVRQFNPIMAVFNHDFSIHQQQQHHSQQQSQKLSPQEFASILQSIGVSCNHKVLVVSNLKLTKQEIQDHSILVSQSNQLCSQIPEGSNRLNKRNNNVDNNQQRDKLVEDKEIIPSNPKENPKKKGRLNQIPKEPKKQTLTKKLKTNLMDFPVNNDDKMLDIAQPDEIVITFKAKQLILDILQIQEGQINLQKVISSNFNEKDQESAAQIKAQLEAKYQAQLSQISTQLQELQVGNSIDSLILRNPSGIYLDTTPFQLTQITNPKTIEIGKFLRQVLCVNSHNILYPGLLYLLDSQYSFEQATQTIVIDHNYIAQMIVASGYALTEEVNVSFNYLKQQNKLTRLNELERLNVGTMVDAMFNDEEKVKKVQDDKKMDFQDKNGFSQDQQADNILELKQDIEEVTLNGTESPEQNNYANNKDKKPVNDSVTQAIECIEDKIKLRGLKMKYACKLKQSKYLFNQDEDNHQKKHQLEVTNKNIPGVGIKESRIHQNTQNFNNTPNCQRDNQFQQEQQQLAMKEKAKLILLKKMQLSNPLSCSVFDLRRNRRVYLRDAKNGQLIFFNQDNQLLVIYNKINNYSSNNLSEDTMECSLNSQTESLSCDQKNQQYLLEIYIFNVQIQGQRVHLVLNELPSSNYNYNNINDDQDNQILFSVHRVIPTCGLHLGSSITYDDENVYKILGKSYSSHSTLPVIEIINRKTQTISQITASGNLMPTAVQGFSSAVVFSPLNTKKFITIYGGYSNDNNPVTQTALLELNLLDFRCCEVLNKKDFFQYQLEQSRKAQNEQKKECGNHILNGRTAPLPTKSMWSTLSLVFPNSTSHYDNITDTLYVFGGMSHWEQYVCLVKITKVMETSSMRHVQYTKYELDQSLELDPTFPIPQKLLFKPIFFNFMQSLGCLEREPDCVEPLNFKFTQNNTFQITPETTSSGNTILKKTIIRFGSQFAAEKQEIQQIFSVEFENDPQNPRDSLPIINIHMKSAAK